MNDFDDKFFWRRVRNKIVYDAYICDVCGEPPYTLSSMWELHNGRNIHYKCNRRIVSMSNLNCYICNKNVTQWILEDNKYYHGECYKLMKSLSEERIAETKHLQSLWAQHDKLSREIRQYERKFSEEELNVLMKMNDV